MEASWRAELFAWEAEQIIAGLAPGTIGLRLHWMRHLSRHCSALVRADPARGRIWIWEVTRPDLVSWLARPDWKPETRRSAKSSARSVYRWAAATGRVPEDPTETLPRTRVPPPTPRPAPDEAIRQGMREADDRVELMIRLAAEAGLRRREIAGVHTRHLHGRRLHVTTQTGKGSRARWVEIPADLAMAISTRPPGWLFPNFRTGQPLTPGHVGRLISAGLPGPWTAHPCRHAAASAWADEGLDLDEIAEQLGHASIVTTRGYVLRRRPRVRAAVDAAARRLTDPFDTGLAAGS